MQLGEEFLYLSNADIEACALGVGDVDAAIERMFLEKATGAATMQPKLSVHAEGGTLFLASAGVLGSPAQAGVKWVGVADAGESSLPHIAGLVLLNDSVSGMPLAVMDARWITAMRTAAITAVAARRLASKDSKTVCFIACGVQARAHLAALRAFFPLQAVRAYSRRLATAERFVGEVRGAGLQADAFDDPRSAVEGADIVITSTPVVPRTEPFVDAGWLAPGAFAGMVDLGFSWIPERMNGFACVVTDDSAQAGTERLAYPHAYDGEVADLVAGSLAGRKSAQDRTALVFAGIGLADVAVAAAVFERAREMSIGRVLPL